MAFSNSKTLKTSVLSVTALAASSAWGKSGFGLSDGPRLGVDFLTLDELPIKNATVCMSDDTANKEQLSGLGSDNPSIVVDSSAGRTVQVSFIVSEMKAEDEDRLLFLVYSTKTSPSPQILTSDRYPELPKLGLEMSELEILGFYQIPALYRSAQDPTKVGQADPSPANKMTVNVNFDLQKIDEMIRLGKKTIYVQAALIRLADMQAGVWENMILSEMDSLTFVANECPSGTVDSYEADDSGTVTKSPPKLPTL